MTDIGVEIVKEEPSQPTESATVETQEVKRVGDIDFPKNIWEEADAYDLSSRSKETTDSKTDKPLADESKEQEIDVQKQNDPKENEPSKKQHDSEKSDVDEKAQPETETEESKVKTEIDLTNFDDTVSKFVENLKDDQAKKDFMSSLTSYEKFQAKNTQNSQKNADDFKQIKSDREEITRLRDVFQNDKVKTALETLSKDTEIEAFREQAKDWFGDDSFGVLMDAMTNGVAKQVEETNASKDKAITDDIKKVIGFNKEYLDSDGNPTNDFVELGKFADKEGYSLSLAHFVKLNESLVADKEKATKKTIKLDEKIKNLESEIEKLQKAKKSNPKTSSGKGIQNTHTKGVITGSFDEAEKNALRDMGELV